MSADSRQNHPGSHTLFAREDRFAAALRNSYNISSCYSSVRDYCPGIGEVAQSNAMPGIQSFALIGPCGALTV
jgi:hypothetical protein